jgi:hypothetical protein
MSLLEELKSKIEKLNKQHHIEVLKILKKNNTVTLNENKSGVYVNLSLLPEQSIVDIFNYVKYIEEQEAALSSLETQKLDFKNTFFNETKRPAPSKWWETYRDQSAAPTSAPPVQTAIGVNPADVQSKVLAGNLFGGMTMESLMKQGIQEELLTNLIQPEEDKTNLFAELLNQTRPYYS